MTASQKVFREKIERGDVPVCQACRKECEVNADWYEDGWGRVTFEESDCCGQPIIWRKTSPNGGGRS